MMKRVGLLVWVALAVVWARPGLADAPSKGVDPCAGPLELLNKPSNLIPCPFVLGEAAVVASHGSANIPIHAQITIPGIGTEGLSASAHGFFYPAATVYIGVSPAANIEITPPSFAQFDSSTGSLLGAGATDMKFGYKQLFYFDPKEGTMFAGALTYKAPTGSAAFRGPGPAYGISAILSQPFTRTLGTSLVFAVNNSTLSTPVNGSTRAWSFTPTLSPFWETRGGTLIVLVVQHNFNPNVTPIGMEAEQLFSRHFAISVAYGGFSYSTSDVSALNGIVNASAKSNPSLFSVGASYLIGQSDKPSAPHP
jgi:hypothetical protein